MPCVASKFKPVPNEKVVLLGADYVVQQHPAASHLPFSAEGKRAIVYNLKAAAGNAWALKVFKKKYQTADLLASVGNLKQLARFPGMLAANRSIIAPTDRPAVECPDLSYATLMPWIPGKTWNDLLLSAAKIGQQGSAVYDPQTGVALCRRFIEVMDELERIGAAHTDIAPGNVMLTLQSGDVQLLDLEDLFLPGAQPPSIQNTGSAGYRHPSADNGKTTWCPEGDRYAVAIMAAEFLIVSNPAFGMLASDTGFFEGDRNSPTGAQRLALAYPFLDSIAPDFARLFKMAWNSSTLESCPRIADLRAALSNVSVPAITNQATPIPGVTWELPQTRAQAAAAGASTANTSQFWTQSGTQGQPAGPPAGIGWGSAGGITSATHATGIRLRPLHWLLIVLGILIVGGILLYQRNAEVERRRSEYERQQLIEAENRRKAEEQEQARLAEQARLKAEADAVARAEAESARYETWLRARAAAMAPNTIQLVFQNQCQDRTIYLALDYLMPNDSGHWLAMGWWKMGPGESVKPVMATRNADIYYYAHSSDGRVVWDGSQDQNAYSTSVADSAFAHEDGHTLEGKNLRTVKMRHLHFDSFGEHDFPLTCK